MRRLLFLLTLSFVLACSTRDDPPPPADGGSSADGGRARDGGHTDGGGGTDAGGGADSGGETDAATDGCAPPVCPMPTMGCRWEGATACTCGTLVCPPTACSPGLFGTPCAADEYCDAEASVCGAGHCAARPTACTDIDAPVCGCDGFTYGNECEAWAMGSDVLMAGACTTPPPDRICRTRDDCTAGEECVACPTPFGDRYVCRAPGAPCSAGPAGCTIDTDCAPTETCTACPTPFGDRHVCLPPDGSC